tara:strand:- start:49612 stop:49908 length:297 start_codon:yes stop_codon:yes gene_type:complete
MNDDELRSLIREEMEASRQPSMVGVQDAVRMAVQETLITLGMDAGNPLQLQQDMAFIRELRETSEKVKSRGLLILVGLLMTALASAVWLGFKASLGTP